MNKIKDGSTRLKFVDIEEDHIEWSRKLFDSLKEGGVWGVPACGLIFTKQGDAMVLTGRMPHDPEMPISAGELLKQQDEMYEQCVVHFGAAGVSVTKNAGL